MTAAAHALPALLAGPILRRVTRDNVYVWLAHSEAFSLSLQILGADQTLVSCAKTSVPTHVPLEDRPAVSWQLGEHLWITLLNAKPQAQYFPLDTLLYYQIVDTNTQKALDLQDVCLTGMTRPSFYIPSKLGLLAYGSCRKAHGLSFDDNGHLQDQDSLALLATQLETHAQTLAERPAMLFLVGDQIYADDVHPRLMGFVQELAVKLMGKSIALPNAGGVCHITDEHRASIKQACCFSSSSSNCHVLSFGEYAALYLVMLGNRVDFQTPLGTDISALGTTFDAKFISQFETRSLHYFAVNQAAVRKVFANTPTYLHFDDHDITDDWNLCRSWYDQVSGSADGKRVIANGLAAYWAFQAWGNHPAAFSERFARTIQRHLQAPVNQARAQQFDFSMWKLRRWGFVLPTTPPIFVLDSRTQRDFGKNNEPPQLMDRYALDWLRGEWMDIANKQQTPIFITGTPVFGFSAIEWLQYSLYNIGRFFGNLIPALRASALDMESWIGNRRGFAFFMDTLLVRMGLKRATFLAGDVHYSFVNRAVYTLYRPNTRETPLHLHCLQLTSSALRNTPKGWRWLETFLANWAVKTRSDPSSPETLPWWERLFLWRLFRRNHWHIRVSGIPGEEQQHQQYPWWRHLLVWRRLYITRWKITLRDDLNWITNRPNIALVYLQHGEVCKQVLLSGNNGDNGLVYELNTEQHP